MAATKLAEEHDAAVKRIASQVEKFHNEKKHFRIYHGSTSSTRPMQFTKDAIVDTSDMHRIFPVDKETMTVKAEPNVSMDVLAAHTIAAGYVPKIVMEFKGITCGGGFAGMSGESSMYRYGLFGNTVSEIEIVLGDGTLEYANREKNADLLQEAHGSLGTFGIITLVTIELLPAKSHVQVQIKPVSEPLTVPAIFEEACSDPTIEYIDGIYFNRRSAVVMFGKMIDYAQRDSRAPLLTTKQVHWFADTIEAHLKKHNNKISMLTNAETKGKVAANGATNGSTNGHANGESNGTTKIADIPPVILTLTDYLFRYDHGAFWGGKLAFKHFHVPQNRITRRLADPFLDSRTCYMALHKTGLADEYVVQDFGIPASTVTQFIEFVAQEMPECQIFLCPLKPAQEIGIDMRFNGDVIGSVREQRIFGVGVYGRGPRNSEEFYELNRELELKASVLLGSKLLYARTYYTAEEFWTIYNKERYDEHRKKWKAETLPSVYDKLHADMNYTRPRRSVRGILETIWDVKVAKRSDYLLKKS
ncbi:Delta(24)-sterol reductase [Fulvia fulva]|uniref:Delta(24)-sterol reductase n=1 Tax=Passalora fulva TaxID=5499 RepID=A0A9Q8P989_PASFU|nr:Delta(24)-sterol reductase [Fulvia fulva]KAK4623890.1 Delta(24)-sterol reductase [Fulvia fulva]KAK4625760.1 Delta(24)-sterol reductase [Fulvia fulva]UJO17701.1 Delta(24)-sterol reductase [Fulvia fulva]WPV15278.1 Delta(24)-sterol reductase [Fulvia fulva]WPV30552.1 Delta(24)-sterol reductase [Fulvia fulva]